MIGEYCGSDIVGITSLIAMLLHDVCFKKTSLVNSYDACLAICHCPHVLYRTACEGEKTMHHSYLPYPFIRFLSFVFVCLCLIIIVLNRVSKIMYVFLFYCRGSTSSREKLINFVKFWRKDPVQV